MHIYNGLGELYAKQGKNQEAEAFFRETLRVAALTNARHSEAGAARAGIAKLPGSSLSEEERERYYEDGLDILSTTEGLGTPRAALIQIDFAIFLAEQGNSVRALEWFNDALEHLSAALPADNSQYLEQRRLYEDLFDAPAP